ncbi:SDR family NAD(P)-dependent oxidoreductase [Pseudomonas pudica]|uniref:Glucose 1-dehydrogenase n=1 Tax=Pseudomonas pudica TaxID=272772 RepID=A0ABS0FUF5_9PSED|nr:glucose 1-dehydrogenase [Pseudomonas pudica]MBF8644008.1 glucose 1-dehydrogenase [Pseudomonas pudica]MBF8758625.1 glucose 1-dehydrogenase [Pseudomonas pudica]
MGRVQGKVAIVTGAGSGLGRAISLMLAREGAQVAVLDISDSGADVVREIEQAGGTARFWIADVSNEEAIASTFRGVHEHFGQVDVLVNNAGILGPQEATDSVQLKDWEKLFKINVTGPFLCTKHAIPYLRQSGRGSIVNMCSIYGLTGSADSPAYHSAKGAVRMMTKTDAIIYAGENIRVNAVCPGTILTPINVEKAKLMPGGLEKYLADMKVLHPLGIGEPDDIAYAVLYLASDESKFMTGSELVVDGGYTAQ